MNEPFLQFDQRTQQKIKEKASQKLQQRSARDIDHTLELIVGGRAECDISKQSSM
jgi:hypothetical protein